MCACTCALGYLACTADFLEVAEFAESCFEPYAIITEKRHKNLTETQLLSSKPANGVWKNTPIGSMSEFYY